MDLTQCVRPDVRASVQFLDISATHPPFGAATDP